MLWTHAHDAIPRGVLGDEIQDDARAERVQLADAWIGIIQITGAGLVSRGTAKDLRWTSGAACTACSAWDSILWRPARWRVQSVFVYR